jgi:hypothetical protein
VRRLRFGRLRYVVIVSYGRTGSTLLQGVLMTAPHVLVRGEQGGTVAHLQAWYSDLCRHQRRLAKRYELSRLHPFFGIGGFPRDEALRRLRALLNETLLRPRIDTAVVGFKENRWPEDVGASLQFIRQLLPGVRFIVNTRDQAAVATSGFWRRRGNAASEVRRRHDAIVAAARGHDDVYFVHYDEWVRQPECLRGLFEWLGIEFRPDRVAEVLRRPHSYRNRSIAHLYEDPEQSSPASRDAVPRPGYVAAGLAAVTAAQVTVVASSLTGVGPFAN